MRKIFIHVKTFFGKRLKVSLLLDIRNTVQQIKNKVFEKCEESAKNFYNIRLIYPMGYMQELDVSTYSLESYKIPNNASLIMLVNTTFTWNPSHKGAGIKLLNGNLTANKNGDSDYQTVFGNFPFSCGRHYWEIKIDKFIDEEDIFVGVARSEHEILNSPLNSNFFWGYMCLCGKLIGPEGFVTDYGYTSRVGDIIGVLLEFTGESASLSFFKNGTKCGIAFSDLEGPLFPSVCMFYGEVQVTLDPKAQIPLC